MLRYVFDPLEFLSPFGIRSLSRYHGEWHGVLKAELVIIVVFGVIHTRTHAYTLT